MEAELASSALDLPAARSSLTVQPGATAAPLPRPAVADWLAAQLRARKISQRLLAQRSGLDHSTVSRLLRGERGPTLETMTKLARGLRLPDAEGDALRGPWLTSTRGADALSNVREALRADGLLSGAQVDQIIDYYVAVRKSAVRRAEAPRS
jgi:transcriptional regulator with XRE-family HTH domain